MSQNTKIEWTDATWSPLRVRVKQDAAKIAKEKGYKSLIQIAGKMAGHVGPHCEHVSPGCEECYSGTNNHRCLPANGTGLPFDRRSRDLVDPFVDEKILVQPLKWKQPRKIFAENQSDLFGEWVCDEDIDRVFAMMALCPHTFQVLTKRPERMLAWSTRVYHPGSINDWLAFYTNPMTRVMFGSRFHGISVPLVSKTPVNVRWPLPNVWLGVSAENQATADERIPLLLKTPAALRFVSYEPALGTVDFRQYLTRKGECIYPIPGRPQRGLDWIIAGGESGPKARPPHPDWFRSARDQCIAAGVPFFFKQWGGWRPFSRTDGVHELPFGAYDVDTRFGFIRVGKKAAGALLDGREWKQFPEVRP